MRKQESDILRKWKAKLGGLENKFIVQSEIKELLEDMEKLCFEIILPARRTPKKEEAQNFVDTYTSEHGMPPTYRQVAEALGLKSVQTAYERLKNYRHKMLRIPEKREKKKYFKNNQTKT